MPLPMSQPRRACRYGDPPKSGPLVRLVWALKGAQTMKGKRHATEQKIRILREADSGKSIVDVGKEHNISEVTFHRWKRPFGQLDVNEAKRMKELERENAELKKMLADSLLKNRVLEAVNAKKW
ncbi:MAG: transposase [Opitutus sp.]|nr:transposase [Opitutus sp.]